MSGNVVCLGGSGGSRYRVWLAPVNEFDAGIGRTCNAIPLQRPRQAHCRCRRHSAQRRADMRQRDCRARRSHRRLPLFRRGPQNTRRAALRLRGVRPDRCRSRATVRSCSAAYSCTLAGDRTDCRSPAGPVRRQLRRRSSRATARSRTKRGQGLPPPTSTSMHAEHRHLGQRGFLGQQQEDLHDGIEHCAQGGLSVHPAVDDSSLNGSLVRERHLSAAITRTLAAASSMASGRPSSNSTNTRSTTDLRRSARRPSWPVSALRRNNAAASDERRQCENLLSGSPALRIVTQEPRTH